MNQKRPVDVVLIVIIALVASAVGYFVVTKNPTPKTEPVVIEDENMGPQTYREQQYGIEITHPETWYAYGSKNAAGSANSDLLSWRGFIPNYDPNKSDEEQELFIVSVFNKNPNSYFDMPKQFITKIRTDEEWEQVTVNGYTGTKITNTTTNTVTDYVFEHDGRLYVLSATQPDLFEEVLFTLTFFSINADINSDNIAELIVWDTRNSASTGYSELHINEKVVQVSGWNPRGDFGIVDINTNDQLKEIAVSDYGPSSDHTTRFYIYDNKNIIEVGFLSGTYDKIVFDGRGVLTTRARGRILDTWFYEDEYTLSVTHQLIRAPKDFYERLDSRPMTVLISIPLYKSPNASSTTLNFKKGDIVTITGCDDIEWCAVKNEQGVVGWFALHNFDVIRGIEISAGEVFDGLSYAD